MKLPNQSKPVLRTGMESMKSNAVNPSGCSIWKKIGCAGAIAACSASCVLGPEVCLPCLAGVGASDCLSCM